MARAYCSPPNKVEEIKNDEMIKDSLINRRKQYFFDKAYKDFSSFAEILFRSVGKVWKVPKYVVDKFEEK